MRHERLVHRFVNYIPEQLEPGVLYISLEYATVVHSCCCGCGQEIVTPLAPTGWQITFDGETISLWPSVGNWQLPCRSHYIIKRGEVFGARPWTDAEISDEQLRDKRAKGRYYGTFESVEAKKPDPQTDRIDSFLSRLWRRTSIRGNPKS